MLDSNHTPSGRTRILEAASDMISANGAGAVTLSAVAKRAGVSRQAVYLFFGSRAGLFNALTRFHDKKSGMGVRLPRTAREAPVREALAEVVRLWFAYLPQIQEIALALQAAAVTDTEAAEAWNGRMKDIRDAFETVARRLAEAALLRSGWSVSEAADLMWAQAHFSTWNHLVNGCRWTNKQACERTVASLEAVLVDPSDPLRLARPGVSTRRGRF